jgi:hypothetical protein
MINDVRNTVLSIISKDNRGFITPFEFNLFAKQAQLEIFGQYVFNYSNAINKQNGRMHGEGYTDIPKNMAEVIDTFSTFAPLSYNGITSRFNLPADYYFLEKLIYNNNTEIEKVSHRKILNLVNANLTAPTTSYPVYTMDQNGIVVYPTTIAPPAPYSSTSISAQYLRYPKDPQWTYSTSPLGDPLFNPGAPGTTTYQDFELPLDDFANLVIKILEYSGISIREQDVVAAAKAEEVQDIQQKQ